MQTITFYSYKGGTGRSLALANAARYLARLGFKVAAIDFDLEAPGLHYKFSSNPDDSPLPVEAGVVDYLYGFMVDGEVSRPIKDFALEVSVPSTDKLISLIPAGRAPSADYWLKLSRINWHDLFYSNSAKGVQILLELKSRILDELEPDFLLVDSRTGITEMGGVATTLFADRVICLVSPPIENLEGARAVLRSLKRSRRESDAGDLEVIVALSRLPQMEGSELERTQTDRIKSVMNEEADDLRDTLSCREVFVLHSEAALQVKEALRVASGVSPDESILLRDYLRLFASFVPSETVEPKVHVLIQQAKEKIWQDPSAAVKEMEELAESFGHPDNYRELLRFYSVRNIRGPLALRRAQALWELTRDSSDTALWQAIASSFDPKPRWQRGKEWAPSLDFIREVWRDAGNKDPEFGKKLAAACDDDDRESLAADVLLEVMNSSGTTAELVAACISSLDAGERGKEADALIQEAKTKLIDEPKFVEAWAKHALKQKSREGLLELIQPSVIDKLRGIPPTVAIRVYLECGLKEEAGLLADAAMNEVTGGRTGIEPVVELGDLLQLMGRRDDFEKLLTRYPPDYVEEVHRRLRPRRRIR
jgi:MinD-like ATPase involved in chromosome partitioning or flagellar assembly